MISTELVLSIGDGSYRNTTGFYFGKWFDEPFTVDVINRTMCNKLKAELCSQADDREHKDYQIVGEDFFLYYVDSKTHSHNYAYKDSNGNTKFSDLLPVGEHVLNSKVHYLSFVHRGLIHIFPRTILNTLIQPVKVVDSPGQNKSKQILYMYNCYDLIDYSQTQHIDVPVDMMDCYDEAYNLFVKYKVATDKITKKKTGIDVEKANHLMEEFAVELKPIIEKFNNIYDELPKVDIDDNLSDIMSLIS